MTKLTIYLKGQFCFQTEDYNRMTNKVYELIFGFDHNKEDVVVKVEEDEELKIVTTFECVECGRELDESQESKTFALVCKECERK